jgi:RNA polymerase sigma-70 factor (ECF subfamily)
MKSDAQLVREARSDPGAFRELYDRHAEQIYAFVLRRTADPDAAYDLTAETFAQAWLSRRRFRDRSGGLAGPWLYGIARNLIAQSVRRRRIELAACTKLGIRERLDEPSSVVAEPNTRWLDGLDDALAELPTGERKAVELRVLDGLSYDEIAAGLSTSPGAARVRVARGLGRLRDRFIRNEQEAV